MEKVSYGIIGFGGIAENRIAKEGFGLDASRFQGHETAELLAATDINPARKQPAEALGLRWYETAEELLGDERLDAVFIATNNASHAEIAGAALARGKHCLIEKPMAHTLPAARELQAMAGKHNRSLGVDHMMTRNAFNRKARQLVEEGIIGEVNDITLHMEFLYGSTPEEAATWRCARPEEVGGPLGDVGCHCLYMGEFLLDDRITEIACTLTPRTLEIEVENGAYISFRTSRGLNGSARVAFNQPRGGLEGTLSNLGYEIYGSVGTMRSYGTLFQLSGADNEPVQLRLQVETSDGLKDIVPDEHPNIYQEQIGAHAESISEGNLLNGSDGIHNLELLFACYESARNGSPFIRID